MNIKIEISESNLSDGTYRVRLENQYGPGHVYANTDLSDLGDIVQNFVSYTRTYGIGYEAGLKAATDPTASKGTELMETTEKELPGWVRHSQVDVRPTDNGKYDLVINLTYKAENQTLEQLRLQVEQPGDFMEWEITAVRESALRSIARYEQPGEQAA